MHNFRITICFAIDSFLFESTSWANRQESLKLLLGSRKEHPMPRLRTGEIVKIRGWWHARVDYHIYDDQAGKRKRKYITRKANANTKFAARK